MRAAILTGAGGGIGGAIAQALARDGWRVIGLDLAFPRENASLHRSIEVDLRDESVLRATLRELLATETVRGLVNCAGIFPVERFVESDSESWRTQVDVNFLAPIIACHEVVPVLVEAGEGRIVNITSESSRSGAARLAVYAGTKGGLLSFSKSLAQELGRSGVTVNCISPGTIETAGTDVAMAQKIARNIPLGRIGTPRDVAPAVAFLMGEGADYITGQVLSVGGGLTMIG
jgi:2-hydroxycyclohexanecarboxyl-CoA dehydrogenase